MIAFKAIRWLFALILSFCPRKDAFFTFGNAIK